MLFIIALIGLTLLRSYCAPRYILHQRCSSSVGFRKDTNQNFTSLKFGTFVSRTSASLDTLIHMLVENPCQEVSFAGVHSVQSQHYLIYATCNLKRMARFTMQYFAAMDCWHMELLVWDPSKQPGCLPVQVAPAYQFFWSVLLPTVICLGFTKCEDAFTSQRVVVILNFENIFHEYNSLDEIPMDANLAVANLTGCLCSHIASGKGKAASSENHFEEFWNAQCGEPEQPTVQFNLVKTGFSALVVSFLVVAILSLCYQILKKFC